MKDEEFYELRIPVPDQTTEEVEIVNWRKNEGDQVKKGEIVFEIETDKATLEVESFGSGVLLKRFYEQGAKLPVGSVVALLGPAGTKVDDSLAERLKKGTAARADTLEEPAAKSTPPTDSQQQADSTPQTKKTPAIKASPNARRLANELGVDLSKVSGTGRGGRIEGDDVRRYSWRTR